MNVLNAICKWRWMLMTLFSVLWMTSCGNIIYDEEGDCDAFYRIRFKYDMNMKFADAFAHEVKSVSLYVFDEADNLVWSDTDINEVFANDEHAMTLKVAPGNYRLYAWCGLMNGESFTLQDDLSCKLNRSHDTEGQAYVDKDLLPLFHGAMECTFPDEPGTHTYTMSLTKNTNVVRVVLQHLSGQSIDKEQFSFRITDTNGWMDTDNHLLPDEAVDYYAWHTDSGTAGVEERAITEVSAVIAELTVARLVKGQNPKLVITDNESGKEVVRIPLIDYALLVKGNYNRDMSDQEYLDRQDEYNLTFFLDENNQWMSAYIYINSWKVVLQYTDL